MQKVFSIIILCFFTFQSNSQQLNIKSARKVASEKLKVNEKDLKEVPLYGKIAEKLSIPSQTDNKPFYIFNKKGEKSFVIVSGDKRMKHVLGYCDNIDFSPETIPCGLSFLLKHYSEQHAFLQEFGFPKESKPKNLEIKSISDVKPLIESSWGQDSPYNDNCPSGCPSGCVATAMAQIMRSYKYPDRGKGFFSYTSRTNNYRLSYNYEENTFEWEHTQNSYLNSFGNTESREATANILKACGVSVGMDYAKDGSGAYDIDIPYALKNYFLYNSTVALYERSYFESQEWYNKVYEELENGRPILYCGQDKLSNGGHAFIIDGYRNSDGKFHVNWGWNGKYDGYYELDALDPHGYRFSTGQSMIVRFCPKRIGDDEDTFYAEEFRHNGRIEVDKSLQFYLTGAVNCSNSSSYVATNSSFNGVIGIGIFDRDGNFLFSVAERKVENLRSGYTPAKVLNFIITIPSSKLHEKETYYISPYAKSISSTTPTKIRTSNGLTDYYTFSLDGEGEKPEPVDPAPTEETIMTEGFEKGGIPSGWSQQNILGVGTWKSQLVLFGDDNSESPNPAAGNGYAFLNYNSGTSFANIRTVTRLESPQIYGNSDQEYILTVKFRKFESRFSTNAILSILIKNSSNSDWEAISEQVITSSNTWQSLSIPLRNDGTYQIGFEGSIEYGACIFIDDIKIAKAKTSSIVSTELDETDNSYKVYDISGRMSPPQKKSIYILKSNKGTSKKIIDR